MITSQSINSFIFLKTESFFDFKNSDFVISLFESYSFFLNSFGLYRIP